MTSENLQPHGPPPHGFKHVFIPALFHPFAIVSVHKGETNCEFKINEQYRYKNAVGFYAVYDSLAALREDYPDVEFLVFLQAIEQTAPGETSILDLT